MLLRACAYMNVGYILYETPYIYPNNLYTDIQVHHYPTGAIIILQHPDKRVMWPGPSAQTGNNNAHRVAYHVWAHAGEGGGCSEGHLIARRSCHVLTCPSIPPPGLPSTVVASQSLIYTVDGAC